jgi:hypothetical protein
LWIPLHTTQTKTLMMLNPIQLHCLSLFFPSFFSLTFLPSHMQWQVGLCQVCPFFPTLVPNIPDRIIFSKKLPALRPVGSDTRVYPCNPWSGPSPRSNDIQWGFTSSNSAVCHISALQCFMLLCNEQVGHSGAGWAITLYMGLKCITRLFHLAIWQASCPSTGIVKPGKRNRPSFLYLHLLELNLPDLIWRIVFSVVKKVKYICATEGTAHVWTSGKFHRQRRPHHAFRVSHSHDQYNPWSYWYKFIEKGSKQGVSKHIYLGRSKNQVLAETLIPPATHTPTQFSCCSHACASPEVCGFMLFLDHICWCHASASDQGYHCLGEWTIHRWERGYIVLLWTSSPLWINVLIHDDCFLS